LTVLTVPLYLSAVRRLTGDWHEAVSKTRHAGNPIVGSNPTMSVGVTQFSTAFPHAVQAPFRPQRSSGLEAEMTRRKQPWGEQRGWIVPADGSPPQELPPHMVGHKLISWPGTMPEKQPAEPVKDRASKTYYHRHVLNPEGVSVYVSESRDAESLPEAIKNEIRRQLKGQS